MPEHLYNNRIVDALKTTLPHSVIVKGNVPYLSAIARFRPHNIFYGSKIDLCISQRAVNDPNVVQDLEDVDLEDELVDDELDAQTQTKHKLQLLATLLHVAGKLVCARAASGILTYQIGLFGLLVNHQTRSCIPLKLLLNFREHTSILYTTQEEFAISTAINNMSEYLVGKLPSI